MHEKFKGKFIILHYFSTNKQTVVCIVVTSVVSVWLHLWNKIEMNKINTPTYLTRSSQKKTIQINIYRRQTYTYRHFKAKLSHLKLKGFFLA